MEKIVIMGGGVAGLTCLNALLDRGFDPLLLEAGQIGSPKMCGEFIGPETVNVLYRLGLSNIQLIQKAHFHLPNNTLKVDFPDVCGALSRAEAEVFLANRAKKLGGRIQENISVVNFEKNSPFRLQLSNHQEFLAETLIVASGKFSKKFKPKYWGIKFHVDKIFSSNSLEMFCFKDAYLGIVALNENTSNCACILKYDEHLDKRIFFKNLISQQNHLKNFFKDIDINNFSWLEGKAPEFAFRNRYYYPNVFWIGDAFASFHPAIGSGFQHSVSSALSAAEHYILQQPKKYFKMTKRTAKTKLFFSKTIHQVFFHPTLTRYAFAFLNKNKWLVNFILKKIQFYLK